MLSQFRFQIQLPKIHKLHSSVKYSIHSEPNETMSGFDRLKRRTGASRNTPNCDTNYSGLNTNGSHDIALHRSYSSDSSQPLRGRRRRIQRKKRSLCLERIPLSPVLHTSIKVITPCTPPKGLLSLLCAIILYLIAFDNDEITTKTSRLRKHAAKGQREIDFQILFPNQFSGNFATPDFDAIERGYQDYGGLEIKQLGQKRRISDLNYLSVADFRPPGMKRDDDGNDAYFAFDDDYMKGVEGTMNHNPTKKICRRTSAHRLNLQNCNTVFETDLLDNEVKYLNAGSYRQVFSLEHSFLQQQETIAVKDMYSGNDYSTGDFEFVRMDAMVAERLTSSPRIYDIYGFCGLSILSEFFPHGDIEDQAVTGEGYLLTEKERETQQRNDLKSYNDIPTEQKLVMSLHMAEALADLHGDPSGVIVHQDVQLSQYLFNAAKTKVKLNDFNRAEFMLWDDKEGNYCKYAEGKGHGNWRSPEEYFDADLNEQVDVYSLGNNMYSLLTGLWVFYDEENDKKVQKRVMNREKPFIDPRYKKKGLAEAKLAEIIAKCHSYVPEDRPSIFEVVRFLRDALQEVTDRTEDDENH